MTRLGVPILIAQIGFTLQGMADTIMVGQHHAQELSAVGFVNSILVFAIILSLGFSQGAVAVIGSLYTQGKNAEIAEVLKASIVADMLQMLLLTLMMTGIYFCLPMMGLDSELLPLMQRYYLILLPSLLLFGNVWNILFNWLLIFGNDTLHIPEMGIEGAAYATATSRLLMVVLFLFVVFGTKRYEDYMKYWKEAKVTWPRIVQLNKLGWPIGVQMSFELAAFAGAALMLGWGGKTWDAASALASHQVMNSIASLIYMFYIGIGTAIAIRVANYHGLEDNHGVRCAANAGYQMILLTGIIASALVFGFRHELAALFVNSADAEMFQRVSEIVAATTVPVILYQFGDGLQTAYVNALRGYGEVKVLMKYSFLAYVVISIPMSYLFGIVMDWGCYGIWMGMPFGLTVVGILYLLRFRIITRHHEATSL